MIARNGLGGALVLAALTILSTRAWAGEKSVSTATPQKQAEAPVKPQASVSAPVEALAGAKARSGDVIVINGQPFRLWGVVAPRLEEFGGYTAFQWLIRLVADGVVRCRPDGELLDTLPVARCTVDGRDLGAALVSHGFARDCPRLSHGTYAAQERAAPANVSGGFDLPPSCLEE